MDSKYFDGAISLRAVWEHNEAGGILWSVDYPGASGRGATLSKAQEKLKADVQRYCQWCCLQPETKDPAAWKIIITQEVNSSLQVEDADSDVLFHTEQQALPLDAYKLMKERCILSAQSFMQVYQSIPKKLYTDIFPRKTFYGRIPTTAQEMYDHTNQVTSYYMGEIGIPLENLANMYENRLQAFSLLEQQPDFLQNRVYIGNYNEAWSLAKVMRRFIWHDTIHAKAMVRMALRRWDSASIANPYKF